MREAQMQMYGSCVIPHDVHLKSLFIGEKADVQASPNKSLILKIDGEECEIRPGFYEGDIELLVR